MNSKPDLLSNIHALRESDAGFRVLADTMPQMVWSTLPDGFHDYYNARWYEFTGMADGSTDGEGWNDMFHPDDQARAWQEWSHSLATGDPYEIEYRVRHRSGEYRWTIGRAHPIRDGDGKIVRWIGTCTDIDDSKRQSEQTEVMSRELSHRIKNIFAVINGLIGLSVRQDPTAKSFASTLLSRISALGRAHEFARPHSEESRLRVGESTLHGMLREIMRPYPALDEGRIVIEGDDIAIDDRGATPLAMVFHELATNAVKYGAMAFSTGRILIRTRLVGDDMMVEWSESGGPSVEGEPAKTGFGTKLVEMSVVKQLSGEIERFWNKEGLVVRVKLQPPRLIRR